MADKDKNNRIKETYAATMLKRSGQSCKVFSVKIQKKQTQQKPKGIA